MYMRVLTGYQLNVRFGSEPEVNAASFHVRLYEAFAVKVV